jgi:PAS domain S-box-containing protein
MGSGSGDADPLDRWLSGDGLITLDGVTGGSLDVIEVVDRELMLRYLNWTTPGLTREDAVGKSALELIPPGYKEIARDVFARVLRTGIGESFETLYRNDCGVLIWIVRVGPIRHEGAVIGLVTINTDVTEQRRGDVDRDRFFSLSLDMLVVVTREGLLKRVNPAFGEVLGYEMSDVIGKPFIDFVHPDDCAATMEAFGIVTTALSTVDKFENRYRRSDGTYRAFSWRGTVDPLTGDSYGVARDITDQRAAEAQLRHAQKMEAVGQLAGGIAHDFNNLMQAVLGNVELALSTRASSPDVEEHLHEIAGAGRRAAELTKQLLVFSRRQPLHPVLIDTPNVEQRSPQLEMPAGRDVARRPEGSSWLARRVDDAARGREG